MAVITSKTLKAKDEQAPEPKPAPKTGELASILNQIKRNCSPASEISRLCDRALELVK